MSMPQERRNDLLAQKLINSLGKRNISGYFCKTGEDARKKALELIKEESTITWGGGMTLRDIGLAKTLIEGNYEVYDRDAAPDATALEECMRKAFFVDWYISGINGLSEDGQIVNVDGRGNRVAAITFGPKQVLFIVGLNKVTQDLDSAIKRARSTAAPMNNQRFDTPTPCHIDGVCHNCTLPECICNYIHILRNSNVAGKYHVILVDEFLGF